MGLSLLAESWTWYGFVILVVIFRFVSRINHVGNVKDLSPEDWLMVGVVAFYTVLVVFMNIVANVETNLIDPTTTVNLTPESIQRRIYGSKMVLLVEQCMIMTQWGCKFCLLMLYYKITFGLKQQLAVKVVGVYVVVTLVVMEICYFGVWCRPFHGYWTVPQENIQCSAAIHHLIMNAVFNITSDVMMLGIPLPVLISSKLPVVKKAALCVLFGMGTFVILCAALNKYYSFTQPFAPDWTFWYIREASVAILIANIPNCWPLLRRIFKLKSFNGTSDRHAGTSGANLPSRTANSEHQGGSKGIKSMVRSRLGNGSQMRDPETGIKLSKRERQMLSRTDSQTELKNIESEDRSQVGSDQGDHPHITEPLEIWRKDEVTVDGEREENGERIRSIMYGGTLGASNGFRTKTVVTAQEMRDHHHHHGHPESRDSK